MKKLNLGVSNFMIDDYMDYDGVASLYLDVNNRLVNFVKGYTYSDDEKYIKLRNKMSFESYDWCGGSENYKNGVIEQAEKILKKVK